MSEPRKLYTGSASGGLDQEQYEAARRRAQQLAEQNARRRTVQQPMRTAQGRHISQRPVVTEQPAPAPEPPVQERAQQAAPAPEKPRELTYAQRQAMAYRAAAERRYGDTLQFQVQRPRRTVNRPPEPEQRARQAAAQLYEKPAAPRQVQQPAPRPQAQAPVQQAAPGAPAPVGGIRLEEAAAQPRRAKHADAPQPAAHKPRTAAGGNGGSRKPPRDEDDAPRKAKGGKSGKKGGSGKGGNGKKKKKIRWWQILLITLLVIALIFGGAFALIMGAITPEGGNIKLNQLINTPKEFQGKELNFLMVGIDRSSQKEGDDLNDAGVDDGNTDMILYVHFNNETGEMKMLQIPRDTMVTTDRSVSGNYRINNIAKTQAADSNSMNMAALCEQISNMYQLPIDGYMTIRLEMLVQLVDTFGGIELYVPQEMDYKGSHLDQGYQTLNGDACEFLLRTRHVYNNGDIGRLNMQRQFYSALFRRLKSIGNIWDVAKLTPAVLNYMETNLSASDLISFAISMLKIDSSKIMICQMPVISGPKYNKQDLLYPARQADADLLNQYFRENTGPVDASALNLCDNAVDVSGYAATDPNIQWMGKLMTEADEAQKDPNQNLDGSNQVTDVMASEPAAGSESESTEAESQPAA